MINLMIEYLRNSSLRYWRFLSPIGLIIGILLPWKLVYSDVIDFEGHEPTRIYGWQEIKDTIVFLNRGKYYVPEFQDYLFLDAALLLGACCLVLYVLGNSYQILTPSRTIGKNLVVFLQITSISSVLVLIPNLDSPMYNSGVASGYFITAITILGSILLEGTNKMYLNTKYPYFVAWAIIISVNSIAGAVLLFVPYDIIRLILQVVIGFFIFRFVVEYIVLPYIAERDAEAASSEIQ